MEIKIVLIERFDVEINGKSIGEFKKDSSWNGITRIVNEEGLSILYNDDSISLTKVFEDIFNPEKHSTNTIIKISPSLIPVNGDNNGKEKK